MSRDTAVVIVSGISVIVLGIRLFSFYDGPETRTKIATDTAEKLQLENPTVYCEDVFSSCGCIVTYGPYDNRRVESWKCCGGGCE